MRLFAALVISCTAMSAVAQTRDDPPMDEVMITGRRIDGLNNRGLLQNGENGALYHDVVTSEEIERLGVSSIEELFRLITQTSSASTSLQDPVRSSQTTGGFGSKASTIGLRGFASAQTVLLINGRALPRTGVFNGDGADLDRIPIAAIERIEILPYAGSAIYGAGAIGGAINVVLRKEYAGNDLNVYLATTTEGGASEYRLTYTGGTTFNEGNTSLAATVSYHHRDALRAGDRDYLDEGLRRYGPDSTATDVQGRRLFESLVLPAFASSPGTIRVASAPNEPINDLGIPGAPGVRFAAIPAGMTGAGSLALTPASFTGTAGEANLAPRYGRSILYEPTESYDANMQWGHDFAGTELQAYGELTLGYGRKDYSAPQLLVLDLSATDPLNPFRTNVTPGFVGRPITIFLDTPDLPDPSVLYEDEYARTVIGLKGKLSPQWEWSADGVIDYARNTADSHDPSSNVVFLNALAPFSNPGPPAPAAIRRAIYPILADHGAFPIAAADASGYFDFERDSTTRSLQWEGNARILGTVVDLPAGPLQTSVLGKYQYWDFIAAQRRSYGEAFAQLVHNDPSFGERDRTLAARKIFQGALEISIPIITSRWRPVPIESFEIQGSVSRERHASRATDPNALVGFSDTQSASSNVIAGRLQVIRDVAFRASWSEGFYPPNWLDVGLPVTPITLPGFFADPARGNTLQFFTPGAPLIQIQQGGNRDLKPESATSKNFGILLTPRFVPNLSLHVDYWRIEKTDAVVSTSFSNIIANPDVYGFRITRTAPSAADIARGWLGFITAVDARSFNAAITRTSGFDVQVRYQLDTASVGTFEFVGSGTFTDEFELLATPSAPVIDTSGGSGPIRRRAHGSLTWTKGGWSSTLTGRYVGWRSTLTTAPSPSYPGASGLDGERIPGSLRWDVQLGYEVPERDESWLSGTRFTLGAINVLNEEPAFVSDGFAFYNTVEDPRQRVLYLQIRRSF